MVKDSKQTKKIYKVAKLLATIPTTELTASEYHEVVVITAEFVQWAKRVTGVSEL